MSSVIEDKFAGTIVASKFQRVFEHQPTDSHLVGCERTCLAVHLPRNAERLVEELAELFAGEILLPVERFASDRRERVLYLDASGGKSNMLNSTLLITEANALQHK